MSQSKGTLEKITRYNDLLLLIFVVGSFAFRSHPITLGLLLGGGLVSINFRWLRRIAERVLLHSPGPPRPFIVVSFLLKYLFLIGSLLVIVRFARINLLAFLVGTSTVVLAIFLNSITQWLCSPNQP